MGIGSPHRPTGTSLRMASLHALLLRKGTGHLLRSKCLNVRWHGNEFATAAWRRMSGHKRRRPYGLEVSNTFRWFLRPLVGQITDSRATWG